jgi:DNA polymerase-3 subunit gamma/tau
MLYQTVRPPSLKEVRGNKSVVASLAALIQTPKRPHTYLFSGPSGCGKTTLARIFAAALGCDGVDLQEINTANTRGLDTIRSVADSASIPPMFGQVKVYIFDESHQLTAAAQEALLKVVEDCPKHAYFIFCTTEPENLIKTLRNRCTAYTVAPLRRAEMTELLKSVAAEQKLNLSDDLAAAIVEAADGCPRQALVFLEAIQNIDDPAAALQFLMDNIISETDVLMLCKELYTQSIKRWANCTAILKALPDDTERNRLAVLSYFNKVLLGEVNDLEKAGRYAELISIFEKSTYTGGRAAFTRMVFEACLV